MKRTFAKVSKNLAEVSKNLKIILFIKIFILNAKIDGQCCKKFSHSSNQFERSTQLF